MSVYKERIQPLVSRVIARCVPRGVLTNPTLFSLWEKRGIHVLPASFYSPVPVVSALNGHESTRREMPPGVQWREQAQLELLDALAPIAASEAADLRRYMADRRLPKGAYGGADMMTLYCLLRHIAPRHIIEVGAGVSTFITAYALQRNAEGGEGAAAFTSIDPYPNQSLAAEARHLCENIVRPVQEVPVATFAALDEGDVLFIDSTHVCKVASDVNHLILDVLPRLKPGVWVHFHDIFLPNDYPRAWIERTHRFWNEQYLLQAFLAFNDAFQVEFATNHLSHTCGDSYPNVFQNDEVDEPGSFWIRKIA